MTADGVAVVDSTTHVCLVRGWTKTAANTVAGRTVVLGQASNNMIFLWTRIIPLMLGLALAAAVFGPTPLPEFWSLPGHVTAALYLLYAVLLCVLAAAPVRAVALQTPAAGLSAVIGVGSLTSSMVTAWQAGVWSTVGAVTGTFAIFGILFSWHWLMARFWFRIFPAHGYGPTPAHTTTVDG